jgi:hypothetical protein
MFITSSARGDAMADQASEQYLAALKELASACKGVAEIRKRLTRATEYLDGWVKVAQKQSSQREPIPEKLAETPETLPTSKDVHEATRRLDNTFQRAWQAYQIVPDKTLFPEPGRVASDNLK